MSRAERAVKDAAKLYGAQLAAGAFAVVFSAWLARTLPSVELSLWPVYILLSGIVQVFASFGISDLFVRLVPSLLKNRKPEEAAALLRTGLTINIIATLLLTGVLLIAAEQVTSLLLDNEVDAVLVRMLGAAVLFTATYKHLERTLYAVQEFGKVAVIRLLSQICRPSLAVGLYLAMGIKGAILALSVVPFLAAGASIVSLWPYLMVWGYPQRPRYVLAQALPFYGASLANLGTSRLDYLIVGALTTPTRLAGYYVARKIADYLRLLNISVIEAIEPKLAEDRGHAKPEIEGAFTRCSRYLLLGLLPLHVGLAVTAGPIVALYAGGLYPAAGPILSLLSLALFGATIASLYRAHIKVFSSRWHLTALDATSGLISVGLSAAFVLWIGTIGVPLAQTMAYIAQGTLAIMLLRRILTLKYDAQAVWAAGLGSGLVGAVGLICVGVIPSLWSLPAAIALGTGVYFVTLIGRLNQEDANLLLCLLPFRSVKRVAGLLCRPAVGSS